MGGTSSAVFPKRGRALPGQPEQLSEVSHNRRSDSGVGVVDFSEKAEVEEVCGCLRFNHLSV